MYNTTGLTREQFAILKSRVEPIDPKPQRPTGRRQALDLRDKLVVTLAYMRKNRTQGELAEAYQAHQTTISDIIIAYTPAVTKATADFVPTADDLPDDLQLVIDGTLVPSWSWEKHPEDYSGKHHTTGRNLQVACTLAGNLAWISDPTPGSTHDAAALRASGLLDAPRPAEHIADKGYQGLGLITPEKKPIGQEFLSDDREEFNHDIGAIRYVIERAIANIKAWRILHTDYRRPHKTHPSTISAVVGLLFLKLSFP
jgi:hypothetical protein